MKLLMVLSIVNLLAAIFLPACNSAGRAISDTTVQGVDIAATTAVPTPTTEIGALKVYHNPQAGYRAEYPAGWSVNEQVGADGSIATTFSPRMAAQESWCWFKAVRSPEQGILIFPVRAASR